MVYHQGFFAVVKAILTCPCFGYFVNWRLPDTPLAALTITA